MTSKLPGPDDGSADDDFADKLDARCAQNIEHVEVFARRIVGLLRMTPAK